jgi:4a-hydroxytetrahydrobiopterin dehydratase
MPTQALTEAQISEALAFLDGWEHHDSLISKRYRFSTYPQGLAFATAAGMVADGFNHHPEISIGYKTVTISLTTHDAGNRLSQKDVDVASAIDAIRIRA